MMNESSSTSTTTTATSWDSYKWVQWAPIDAKFDIYLIGAPETTINGAYDYNLKINIYLF